MKTDIDVQKNGDWYTLRARVNDGSGVKLEQIRKFRYEDRPGMTKDQQMELQMSRLIDEMVVSYKKHVQKVTAYYVPVSVKTGTFKFDYTFKVK